MVHDEADLNTNTEVEPNTDAPQVDTVASQVDTEVEPSTDAPQVDTVASHVDTEADRATQPPSAPALLAELKCKTVPKLWSVEIALQVRISQQRGSGRLRI